MSQAALPLKMTYAEYLAFEERSDVRHEFHDGDVYEVLSMSGGTLEHARLASAFGREFGIALAGRPCAVFSADGRIRVTEGRFSGYPDLSVVCGRIERRGRPARSREPGRDRRDSVRLDRSVRPGLRRRRL
jgi:Uma2 family endonuclease